MNITHLNSFCFIEIISIFNYDVDEITNDT
jgi:hypothetical protein